MARIPAVFVIFEPKYRTLRAWSLNSILCVGSSCAQEDRGENVAVEDMERILCKCASSESEAKHHVSFDVLQIGPKHLRY